MYTSAQTHSLQNISKQFLNEPLQENGIPQQLQNLKDAIRFHEYRYYILNEPLLADTEYDQLYKQLAHFEKLYPHLISTDSPTQRIGNSLNQGFQTVSHLVPMLSLDNSYNAEDLIDFDRKARELSGIDEITYCIEPKFDGASISLIYENDHLVSGVTRGDGVEGEEITNNIKQIRSIPLTAKFSEYGIQQIEIRGEIIMNKDAFNNYNNYLAALGSPSLANPRNAASGSLRMKDPKDVAQRNLNAFLYHISYYTSKDGGQVEALSTHAGSLQLLWDLGFRSPQKEKRVVKGIQPVIDFCLEFEAKRDELPYEIDGMVVKVNELSMQEQLGMTSHHPRWAIAFKFKARQATTRLRAIEFQVGRTGAVTPVAKLDPVYLAGVTVSSISVHNEEYIREKDLKIGDHVLIERAGDVIPQIVKSLVDLRTGEELAIEFPKKCPVCNSQLFKEEAEAVWRCINIECEAQVVERMIHFVSKDAMDIKNFGEAYVRKFYELGYLKDIPGIYLLPYNKISMIEGFGKKSIEKLQLAIETSKQQPMHRLIYALGIRFVGETTAKTLANAVETIYDFITKEEEALLTLDDVGIKVAKSIHQFFQNEQNIEILHQLEALGIQTNNVKKEAVGKDSLGGQTFLFTGTLNQLKRSDAEIMVEQNGGKIVSGVSSKLNYLIVGDDAGSKLEKAKRINTIKIISEAEFLNIIEQNK